MSVPIRNIAIIAHVDHGKTTLVDHLLRQSGSFRENLEVDERFMDSMDLERERGITIAAKNASFVYKGVKVNIVDTPGHSDFGGEVERILDMVDGAILLVDASEGPLPQTRFVLGKALRKNIKIIVCINKIDRSDARIDEVHNEIFDLFIDLDATEEQADFDLLYTVGKEGFATTKTNPKESTEDLGILFDWIIEKIPAPQANIEGPLQMLVANIDYDDYVGKLAVGRIRSGSLKVGQEIIVCHKDNNKKVKISTLFEYLANKKVKTGELYAGDIAIVAGFENIFIGDTLTDVNDPKPLERLKVDEPTVTVIISVNNSPFSGLEGKQVTSRRIKERLEKEMLYNVAIQVEPTESPESFKILGRGELQLSVLFEQMRRKGFEFLVSKPQVLTHREQGKLKEPMEVVTVDVEKDFLGVVTRKLGERKGVLLGIDNKGSGRSRAEFRIPARGLIGYRSEFLTDTRGTGLLSTSFDSYDNYCGEIQGRRTGSMISDRKGVATSYALFNLEERGMLFIPPGTRVYGGMIIGEANKPIDLNVNVCREKKLTNVRASGSDEGIKLIPYRKINLELALEWIKDSELIEVTPENIRLRCRELEPHKRKTKIS